MTLNNLKLQLRAVSSKKKYSFLGFLLFLILMTVVLKGIYSNNVKASDYILIPNNSSFEQVASIIKPHLKNNWSWRWVSQLKKYPKLIKSGRYHIEVGMSNNNIINLLRSGNQTPLTVLFNNENSLEQLAGTMASQIETDSLSLLNSFRDTTFLNQHDFDLDSALSMYIPNSYQVYWNITPEQFRDKMFTEFKQFWSRNNRLEKADSLHLSPIQVYTLASIVQQETAKVDERATVAGLYLNRLRKHWPLQADPTVIFALKRLFKKDTIIKRVLNKDLLIKSPYNTYLNRGLPPGPIAMPDVSSIDAVLNPVKHHYFYMCASTTKLGYHEFAKDAYHHAINASKYQRWISKQGIRR